MADTLKHRISQERKRTGKSFATTIKKRIKSSQTDFSKRAKPKSKSPATDVKTRTQIMKEKLRRKKRK